MEYSEDKNNAVNVQKHFADVEQESMLHVDIDKVMSGKDIKEIAIDKTVKDLSVPVQSSEFKIKIDKNQDGFLLSKTREKKRLVEGVEKQNNINGVSIKEDIENTYKKEKRMDEIENDKEEHCKIITSDLSSGVIPNIGVDISFSSRDQSTQTKANAVVNFLGSHSLGKLSSLPKKHGFLNERQTECRIRRRGKGRPQKNKDKLSFHCLLNKDKETHIAEKLDAIITTFVVCSLQDKQVSLKINDFSFWMKNRLFEVICSSQSFNPEKVALSDLQRSDLAKVTSKLVRRRFNINHAEDLPQFRAVFMLDFLIYNIMKTKLITETDSINFKALAKLRNQKELTLPLILASFVFLISNFLVHFKFELFYTYSSFLFAKMFSKSIDTCVLHLKGRNAQLEFSILTLEESAKKAKELIQNAYQDFVKGEAPFSKQVLKEFVDSEKQLTFNKLLNDYIQIFVMLLQ